MWPPPILVKIVCTVAGRTNLRPWRKPINFPQLLHDLPDGFHQRPGGRSPRMLSPTQNPWHNFDEARQLQFQLDFPIPKLADFLRMMPLALPDKLGREGIKPNPHRNPRAPGKNAPAPFQ